MHTLRTDRKHARRKMCDTSARCYSAPTCKFQKPFSFQCPFALQRLIPKSPQKSPLTLHGSVQVAVADFYFQSFPQTHGPCLLCSPNYPTCHRGGTQNGCLAQSVSCCTVFWASHELKKKVTRRSVLIIGGGVTIILSLVPGSTEQNGSSDFSVTD